MRPAPQFSFKFVFSAAAHDGQARQKSDLGEDCEVRGLHRMDVFVPQEQFDKGKFWLNPENQVFV